MRRPESNALPRWDNIETHSDELAGLGDRVCVATSAALLLAFAGSLAARLLGI